MIARGSGEPTTRELSADSRPWRFQSAGIGLQTDKAGVRTGFPRRCRWG